MYKTEKLPCVFFFVLRNQFGKSVISIFPHFFVFVIGVLASNGSPYQPDSLHFADPSGKPNAYQAVSRSDQLVTECQNGPGSMGSLRNKSVRFAIL